MGVRLPGADTPEAFWRNLRDGVESLTTSTDEDLAAAGLPPEALRDPARVRTRPVVDGAELFDAAFFGYSPAEAAATDPQHRLLLECAWEALESAGHDPRGLGEQSVSVFAGTGPDSYFLHHLHPRAAAAGPGAGQFQHLLGNSGDFLASRVSFKLDLTGPSVTVQAGCSTSLVAVHLAAQSLLGGECDLALAGGATVYFPQRAGYVHREGGVNSPDGHCRPFDAAADGTTPGDGVAVLALRRLTDALAAGDPVLGVIRGTAVNNDGAGKAGFTAPAVAPQADVAAEALAVAGLSPADIDYVEAHGTGTPMGDALEIAALSDAYAGAPPGSCRLGSVKPNVGDTWAAAGAVGLVKVLLALEHEELPPLANFTRAHPEIDFASSPFRPAAEPTPWKPGTRPRRAAVHTFGMGGTNAHVIVEEPPRAPRDAPGTGDGSAFAGDGPAGGTGGAVGTVGADEGPARTTDRPAGTAGAFAADGPVGTTEGAAAAGGRPSGAVSTAGGPAPAGDSPRAGAEDPVLAGERPADGADRPAGTAGGAAFAADGPVGAGAGPGGDGSAFAGGPPVAAGGASTGRGVAAPRGAGADGWWVLPLSARTDAAVRRQAALLAAHLEQRPQAPLDEVCRTLLVGRARFARRAVALGRDRTGVLRALRTLAAAGSGAEVSGPGWASFRAGPGVTGGPGTGSAGAPGPADGHVTAPAATPSGSSPADSGPPADRTAPDQPPADVVRRTRAWIAGSEALPAEAGPGRRAVLPTYPFERARHFLDPPRYAGTPGVSATAAGGAAEAAVAGAAGGTAAHPRPALETPYAPAADRLERLVVDAWGDALGIDGVGRDDDFFELGGHSLLAARVTTTLRALLPVTTDVTDLLAAPPTAAGHADRLRQRLHERLAALSDDEAAALAEQLGAQAADFTP